MSAHNEPAVLSGHERRVLAELESGVKTWTHLRFATKLNDDNLGKVVGRLLDLRKIWTVTKEDVRVYGLERRTGLVPRFANVQNRRAADRTA